MNKAQTTVDRPSRDKFSGRSEVLARNGMVVTSQPLASQIGLDILKKGGNAVDAAIAANAALGLMEPYACGLGGDLFAILWDAGTRKLYGLNASGRSPKSLSHSTLSRKLEQSDDVGIPKYGVLPLTVPGAVDGWFTLHERFGDLAMTELLEPAINYAKQGFPVTQIIAAEWRDALKLIGEQPGDLSKLFCPKGKIPAVGDVFKNPDLAQSYRLIAKQGRDVFYKGDMAKRIGAFVDKQGGYLTTDDLASHCSDWVEPLSTNYRGFDVYQMPPNSQGLATLQMLNILEGYDLQKMEFGSPELLHVMTETKKLVYEDRARFYADMAFANIPIRQLLSKRYAAQRRSLITKRAQNRVAAGNPALSQGDTTYIAVADKAGNMVSLIQSTYSEFGSGLVVPETGFTLQNRGKLFSLDNKHRNVYAPRKRPFHTIIPGFVSYDGEPYLSFGVMGGAFQPQGQVQVLTNMIDFEMNSQEAGDAPRWRHDESSSPTDTANSFLEDGGELMLESAYAKQIADELESKGHKVKPSEYYYGGYQAILRDNNGVYHGASESRKDGQAVGY